MDRQSPGALLETVNSKETFLTFVNALIEDRRKADALEKSDPQRYRYDGANGWQNGSIATFLESALACVESGNWPEKQSEAPSWKDFAEFLFMGKIYE